LLVVCGLISLGSCSDQRANLLVHKFFGTDYAAESKDLVVNVTIINVGDRYFHFDRRFHFTNNTTSTAYDVILNDETWPNTEFAIVNGSLTAKWDRIPV
jgi:hypothetical protein